MKKFLVAILACAMMLSSCALADVNIQTFPEKPESYAAIVDPTNPIKTVFAGAFRVDVPVEGSEEKHTAVVYLDEDYSQTQGFIMIVPDSGMTAEQALEEGGWKAVAEANDLYLMVLEPTDSAYADDAYIAAAATLADSRDYWRMPEGRNYIVAYGDAADLAVKFVESVLPNTWAGMAVFGDLSIKAEDIVNQKGTELPVWLFMQEKDAEEEVIELLKGFNGCTEEVYSNAYADEIYFPNQHTTDLLLNSQPMSQVRVSITEDAAALNADRAAYVYDFLKKGTRELGYGDKTMRYTHELSDWGATMESVEINGVTRSWVQYVPTKLRNTEEGKAPLLLTIHGAALNGEYYAERTEYVKLAEEYGFIIVFPTGSVGNGITPSWNASGDGDDVQFIKTMIETLKTTLPVDESRIYVYGHSMGGLFTQNLIRHLDGVFAASFGTGCSFGYPSESDHEYNTPFGMMVGDLDYIAPYGFNDNERLRACLNYHTQYNDCGTVNDVDGAYKMGRFDIYVWENDENVPMVQYFEGNEFPHTATLDGGMLMFNWLSQFCRNADGTIGYRSGI